MQRNAALMHVQITDSFCPIDHCLRACTFPMRKKLHDRWNRIWCIL